MSRHILLNVLRGCLLFILLTSILGAFSRAPAIWLRPIWSIPLRVWHGLIVLAVSAILLYPFLAKRLGAKSRRTFMVLCSLLTLKASWDAYVIYDLYHSGQILNISPIPLSAILTGVLLSWMLIHIKTPKPRQSSRFVKGSLATTAMGLGSGSMLLLLILSFGATDYRRQADCAIVLGAKVYSDGRMSLALSDRVQQGIELYKAGYVKRIVMTGGVDPNGQSEAVAMARAAYDAGVPKSAVILDEYGKNTRASAKNCALISRNHGWSSALVVSHYYHLARCKEAFRREGLRCYTVPAHMTRRMRREPLFILREGAAYLYYAWP
ncbi:MAG: YdcF family protein [Planctomycetota bacterium]|nr:YdcF family protein [Planctomycetota bacterium]